MTQMELQLTGPARRQCPVCGKEVVGRSDKVYCSEHCRATVSNRRWAQANREKSNAIKRRWAQANREKELARINRWRQANRERVNKLARQRYHANAAKVSEMKRRRRQANWGRVIKQERAYRKKWVQANREKLKAKEARRRARKMANGVDSTKEYRVAMVNPLTRQVCHYCGKDCTGDFHWDHFIPISKGGPEAPWNLVVSCPTCNLSKSDKLPESMFCDELGLVT